MFTDSTNPKLVWYLVQVSLAIGPKLQVELINLVWLTHGVQGLLVAASDRMFIDLIIAYPASTYLA